MGCVFFVVVGGDSVKSTTTTVSSLILFSDRARRTCRNFFLQHPVIPRRWRNSIAKEHLGQHLVLDGDTMALHMQVREPLDGVRTLLV